MSSIIMTGIIPAQGRRGFFTNIKAGLPYNVMGGTHAGKSLVYSIDLSDSSGDVFLLYDKDNKVIEELLIRGGIESSQNYDLRNLVFEIRTTRDGAWSRVSAYGSRKSSRRARKQVRRRRASRRNAHL